MFEGLFDRQICISILVGFTGQLAIVWKIMIYSEMETDGNNLYSLAEEFLIRGMGLDS